MADRNCRSMLLELRAAGSELLHLVIRAEPHAPRSLRASGRPGEEGALWRAPEGGGSRTIEWVGALICRLVGVEPHRA